MKKNELARPILKWVGGKRQLLPALAPLFPKRFSSYCEPFLGGGAVLFSLQPQKAIVNDANSDLIGLYKVIRDDVDGLIRELSLHRNTEDHFYEVRDWDRDKRYYSSLSQVKKAARLIFLNKTCYNGLFRVNSAGEFNAPFGHYKNPSIINVPTLRAVSNYFNSADISFFSKDYSEVIESLPRGTFVYLDPPYDPVSDSASFTGYTKGGFSQQDQILLKESCDRLNARGIKFMLSNSATEFIKEQYGAYDIKIVRAIRAVNSKVEGRGAVEEVVVRNYE